MFRNLEKKVNHTLYTLFVIGLVALGLGVVTLLSEVFVQIFVSILFFLLAYAALSLAYRMQIMRDAFFHIFHPLAGEKEKKPRGKK